MGSGDPVAYALSYEAGLKAIDQQVTTLRETRERAGKVLSAATFAVSLLLVAWRFHDERLDWLAYTGAVIAGIGFLGVVFTTVMIWQPVNLQYSQDPRVIIRFYIEDDPPKRIWEVHRQLALWLGDQADTNRGTLKKRLTIFTRGLHALMVEVLGMFFILGD